MSTSRSLALGQSYLPGHGTSVSTFITRTAGAAQRNPTVAAEIFIAATDQLLNKFNAPGELKSALSTLIDKSCKARDLSMQ